MKKILALLISTGIALALISCGTTPKQDTTKPAEPDISTPQEDVTEKPATGAEILVDDFEEGNFFEAVGSSWGDGDVSLSCDLSTDWGTEGGTSLKCTVTTNGGSWEKGGFFTTPYETDWTGITHISMDVKNPNSFDIAVGIVLQNGENWEVWNQCEGQPVAADSTASLSFEIPTKQHLDCVQRVIIYSWGAVPEECSFYVDNIVAYN